MTEIPIIVVSKKRQRKADKVRALDNGARDYLTQTFWLRGIAVARLRVAQRHATPPGHEDIFRAGPLSVDLVSRAVKVRGRRVRLTVTEYTLLRLLVKHAGEVVTHEEVLREVWGPDEGAKKGSLRVYLNYLRGKLEEDPHSPRIDRHGAGGRLPIGG